MGGMDAAGCTFSGREIALALWKLLVLESVLGSCVSCALAACCEPGCAGAGRDRHREYGGADDVLKPAEGWKLPDARGPDWMGNAVCGMRSSRMADENAGRLQALS